MTVFTAKIWLAKLRRVRSNRKGSVPFRRDTYRTDLGSVHSTPFPSPAQQSAVVAAGGEMKKKKKKKKNKKKKKKKKTTKKKKKKKMKMMVVMMMMMMMMMMMLDMASYLKSSCQINPEPLIFSMILVQYIFSTMPVPFSCSKSKCPHLVSVTDPQSLGCRYTSAAQHS